MRKLWHVAAMVAVLVVGTVAPVAAKPGGPGTGGACPVSGPVDVVLDPGHGGDDPGAIDPFYGQREADLTLDIAFRTQAILEGNGVSVALTRYGDTSMGNSERGAIANACGASLFVEIHLNASGDPADNYSQAFWGKKRKDLGFASAMCGPVSGLTGDCRVGQFANGGLLNADMPSTLVETVFLTNEAEATGLLDGWRQDDIAAAVAAGVIAGL